MANLVEKHKEAVSAASFLDLRKQGLSPLMIRHRLICGRWRHLIERYRTGQNVPVEAWSFDLNFVQFEAFEKALDDTEAEFESQASLRREQTADAKAYAELSQDAYNKLWFWHRRWRDVRFHPRMDTSTKRVFYRAIRAKHKDAAKAIKVVLAAKKALHPTDLQELTFGPSGHRYRWAANYKTDYASLNLPPEVLNRRMVELLEGWLASKEDALAGLLEAQLSEE